MRGHARVPVTTPADLDLVDGFQTGDVSRWSAIAP